MVGKIRIIWLYHALVWSPRWVASFSTTTMTRSLCGPKICIHHHATAIAMTENDEAEDMTSGDNNAMAFLRKMGKVGGASSEDLMNAIGVDEGPVGKTSRTLGGKSTVSYVYSENHIDSFVMFAGSILTILTQSLFDSNDAVLKIVAQDECS
jgi:hypothetical protein